MGEVSLAEFELDQGDHPEDRNPDRFVPAVEMTHSDQSFLAENSASDESLVTSTLETGC